MWFFAFQITQLKIASNPFAKGFRDCDPEDWWALTLKHYSFIGVFPHGMKMYNRDGRARELLQNSFVVCFIAHRCQTGGVWCITQQKVPWILENHWILFESQSTVFFCHWQIARHSRNCHNGANSTHQVDSHSWNNPIPHAVHPVLQTTQINNFSKAVTAQLYLSICEFWNILENQNLSCVVGHFTLI